MSDDEDLNLSKMQLEILQYLLLDGANGPQGIGVGIDRPPRSVSQRLRELKDMGLVRKKPGGVWTLSLLGIRVVRCSDR